MSYILLNYAFLLLWNIFGEIHSELFFLDKKVIISLDMKLIISETSTEILRKFVFLTIFERGKPEENLELFKLLFLIKPVIEDKY